MLVVPKPQCGIITLPEASPHIPRTCVNVDLCDRPHHNSFHITTEHIQTLDSKMLI